MTLTQKIRCTIFTWLILAGLQLCWIGLALGLYYGAGLGGHDWVRLAAALTLPAAFLAYDLKMAYKGWRLLHNPFLYLAAIQHDLGGG